MEGEREREGGREGERGRERHFQTYIALAHTHNMDSFHSSWSPPKRHAITRSGVCGASQDFDFRSGATSESFA